MGSNVTNYLGLYSPDKLCLIFNSAPHYRRSIYSAIDQDYDCDWYFGPVRDGIKEMDVTLLKRVSRYQTIGNPQRAYWQRGILRLLFKKKYQTFFMLADVRSVSCWLFFLLAFLAFPQKKIFIWTHGWYGKETGLQAKMKLWLFRHVDGVFLYGNYAKQLLSKRAINPEKLFVIHNSLQYDEQLVIRNSLKEKDIYSNKFGNSNPNLIFVGRLTQVKRLEMVIEAVAKLRDKNQYYNLTIVGNGPEMDSLKALSRERGLSDCVWFYGECYDERTNAELFYNADLCVSPGNVGLTAIHSLMFGTPVLTHDNFSWQMPEFEAVTQGMTGDFFEYGNVDSLADKICSWFSINKGKRQEIRNNCFEEIDKFWTPAFQLDIIKKHISL